MAGYGIDHDYLRGKDEKMPAQGRHDEVNQLSRESASHSPCLPSL